MEISRYPFSSLLYKTINEKQSILMIFCNDLCWCLRASQIINFHKTCEISSCMICVPETDSCQHAFYFGHSKEQTLWDCLDFFVFRTLDITERALFFKTYLSLDCSCKGFACLPNKAWIFKAVRQILFWINIPNISIYRKPTGSLLDFK